ncbi:MAG: ATP-binding protein [Labilithrix sp.]
MKEVSCRVLDVHFRELKKRGIAPEVWTEGVALPLSLLQNRHERIDWADFAQLMTNLNRIWTPDEIEAQGGSWIDSPFLRYARLLASSVFTPKEFYRWMANGTKKGKKGGGSQMHDCTTTDFKDLGPDRLRLEVRIDEPHAHSPEFFLLVKGGFRVVPQMFGKADARIHLVPIERGMAFEIQLPAGSERIGRLRRAYNWISSSRAVATELDDAQVALMARYEEIERQRAQLARQAARLSTAHAVNTVIQHELDLDLTLASIASALVGEAGFARAAVGIDCKSDGVTIQRSFEHGNEGAFELTRVIEGRGGQSTGRLTVWAHATDDVLEREELLDFIVPSLTMAIDNAISYLVVDDYRKGLEIRVAERTAELVKAKEARDRIFANVNHDLRSPLSLILLAVAEARRNGVASESSERTLGAIEHGARRVLRMVDELLILAEGRENEVKLATARCDLGRMSAAVAEAWTPAAEQASLSLVHDCESNTIVVADPNALERILANLVSNALKFTPKDGLVKVSVRAKLGAAVLEVADNGAGIDDDLKRRLFGRFERGSEVRKAAIGGSGLGLSLVRELSEAHGGSVSVLDTPGGGATFRVEIPLAPAGTEDLRASESGPKLRPSDFGVQTAGVAEPKVYEARSGSARATILLAEDDPSLRDHTAMLLSDIYRVIAAPDGLSAIALAKDHSPDLLVTDIQMPNMDGIELTKRFRALPNHRMAPVLMLTTFGNVEDKLAGFDAGALDYIHKPFEPDELRARVRSQLAIRSLALQLLETEKLAALGTLSAGLAHEIRNPANGIVNAVGPLREHLPPEAIEPGSVAAELLDVIEHCSNQVGALSRELLGFKRGVELKRAGIPLDSLLRRIKTTMQHTLDGVQLREALEYKGPIRCAEPLFAQVLTNLLENGAHAAGRGGWVEIRSGLEEQRVVLEVTDSGPGVPEDLRERIFEPFFTTKPAGSGTGLGLSTARDIALRHGGTLDVRRGARGSIFRLTMPLES